MTSTRQRNFAFSDQEHTIELLAAVSIGEPNTKVTSKLGIMVEHRPKEREVFNPSELTQEKFT